jgi:hypothetical protein
VLSEDQEATNLLSGVKTGGKLKRKVLTRPVMTEGRAAHSDARCVGGDQTRSRQAQRESVKTADPEAFDRYLQVYAEVYDTLWDEKLKRRWARNRFGTYIRKPVARRSPGSLKADGQGRGRPTSEEGVGRRHRGRRRPLTLCRAFRRYLPLGL